MNIGFLGFQAWGAASLRSLVASHHRVSIAITHPNTEHDYERIWNESVADIAREANIPVFEAQRVNDDYWRGVIRTADVDLLVLSDWRTWISPATYCIPQFQGINIHDSLLPRYAGFAPINWAIANGEPETGVTVHFLSPELDLGDIVLQRRIRIGLSDTATEIFHKTIDLIAEMTITAVNDIELGRAVRIQQDRSRASFFHKRTMRESLIDWTRPRIDVHNLIRAQSDPYPNAYTYHKGKELRIKRASLAEACHCGTPGRVVCRSHDGVVIICGRTDADSNQAIIVQEVESDAMGQRSANEYFIRMGEWLG